MTRRLEDVTTHEYSRLLIWQNSISLSVKIYSVTKTFPDSEKFGVTNQLRRASVSIASNIAEGSTRGTKRDFISFLRISLGSLAELDTQILIAQKIGYLPENLYNELHSEITLLIGMIHSFIKKNLSPTVS